MTENLEHATIHTIDLPSDFSSNKDSDSSLPKDDHHLIVRRVLGREFRDNSVKSGLCSSILATRL